MADLNAGVAVIVTDNRVGPARSIPATKYNKPSAGEIVPYPRDIDVVGTRRRTWSHHPGNEYYREIVSKTLAEILIKNEDTPMRGWAIKIVDHIMNEREAVFLKADEQNGQWYVMDFAAAVNKSAVALRNAEIKQRGPKTGAPKGGGAKKKVGAKKKSLDGAAGGAVPVTATPTGAAHPQDLPPIKYLEGSPPEKKTYLCVYEAKQGPSLSLNPYCKAIINLMCRQTNAKAAASVLDIPVLPIYTNAEDEPDKQRLIRLQLRQRYIAAMTIGMSPVVFSKKLMELWGGSISARHVRVDKNGSFVKEDLPLPQPVVPGAITTTVSPVAAPTNDVNEETTPNGAADKPTSTNAPPSAEPISSSAPKAATNPQPGATPVVCNQSQVLVKEEAFMTDATEEAVSIPSTEHAPERMENTVQGTTHATLKGGDTAIVKENGLIDTDVTMDAQVVTEKYPADATSSRADPVPAAAEQKEQPALEEAASVSTKIQAVPVSANAAENMQPILEPEAISKGETATTIEEVKDEPLADETNNIVVGEDIGKGDTPSDGKPDQIVVSVEKQDESKVEGETAAREESGHTQEAAKVDEHMNVDGAEELVTKGKDAQKSLEEETVKHVKKEPPPVFTEEDNAADLANKIEESKEEASPKDSQEVKEESAEEKAFPSTVEEREDEKGSDEKLAVKADEVDETKLTDEVTGEKKTTVVEEEKEQQRPRSNSRTRRRKSETDDDENPHEETESPRANERRRKLIEEAEVRSPDDTVEEDEDEEMGGSPGSPGKGNKRHKCQ